MDTPPKVKVLPKRKTDSRNRRSRVWCWGQYLFYKCNQKENETVCMLKKNLEIFVKFDV